MQKTKDLTKLNTKKSEIRKAKVEKERCQNPWNPECNNLDIALYIVSTSGKKPICQSCWHQITETDFKW